MAIQKYHDIYADSFSGPEGVLKEIKAWALSLEKKDPAQMAALYEREGALKGTLSDIYVQGRFAIAKYFEKLFSGVQSISVVFLDGFQSGENWCSGEYIFMITDKEGTKNIKANYTFVLNSEGFIVNHHSSMCLDQSETEKKIA